MIPDLGGTPREPPCRKGRRGCERAAAGSTPLSGTRHTLPGTHLKTSAKSAKAVKNDFKE